MGETELSDEEILSASVTRPDFFNILIERHCRTFFNLADNNFPEEAEDIVQDALLKMFKNRSAFKMKNGARFTTWAHRIVINTIIDRIRMKKRLPAFESLDATIENDLTDQPFDLSSDEERRLFLKKAVSLLPEDLGRVITSHYYNDMTCDDIALDLNCKTSKVKANLRLGRRKLGEILESL